MARGETYSFLQSLLIFSLILAGVISYLKSRKLKKLEMQNKNKEKIRIKNSLQDSKSDQKRPDDWHLRRQYIKQRDGNVCALCGGKEHLQVHHKNPVSKGPDHSEGNLITLCVFCHSKQEGHTQGLVRLAVLKKLETSNFSETKSRKDHSCTSCGAVIQKGECYYSKNSKVGGWWYAQKICRKCF